MDNIKTILNTVIGQISTHQFQNSEQIQRIWASLLHPDDLNHTRVGDFKDGCLVVYIDSPARLYKLKTQYRMIADRLSELMPNFEKLVFKIGKVL